METPGRGDQALSGLPQRLKWISRMCFTVLFLSLWTMLATASPTEHVTKAPLKPLVLQLKWKPQFQFAGYYAALAKGYYEAAGFDVTLRPAEPGIDPITEVLQGKADYGIANSELMLYRLNGKSVTALASVFQHSPIVLMSLASSEIFSPQDLIGKRVMYPESHYGANTLGLMLREGIKPSQFESVPLSFNLDDLITGKVDAMVGYRTDQPFVLERRGIDYRLIDPRSYGIDFYGDTLFTTEQRVRQRPQEVERFREASLKGWRYAIEHREEIIQLLIQRFGSEKSLEELRYEAAATIELIVPELVELGHMNPGRWQHIAETFRQLEMTQGKYERDGFLYEPDRMREARQLALVGQVVVAVALILLASIALLMIFNRRLKSAVDRKTRDLSARNVELQATAKQLQAKDQELSRINAELEARVDERTQSLIKANTALVREVDQRRQREVSLQLLRVAIEHSRSAILIVDADQSIRFASQAFKSLVGFAVKEFEGLPLGTLTSQITLPSIFDKPLKAITETEVYSEVEWPRIDGDSKWLQISISPLQSEGQVISHYVIVCEDITGLKVRKDEMEKLALYDPLTGLDNRALFNVRLQKAIHKARRGELKTALFFIDIDHFKSINDSVGHQGGDTVLRTFAKRLRNNVRENDAIARISGDEFTLLLNDIHDYEDAGKVAQSLIAALREPVRLDSGEFFITASIGISMTPDDAVDMDQLIRNADLAMYQAKQAGRNNFQFFSPEMNKEIRRRVEIEKQLREAIDDGDLQLLFQPKVDLRTGVLVGAEGLLRWLSAEGMRNPAEFIPIAEETGLIVPMGEWVIQEGIAAMQELSGYGFDNLNLSLNISPRQIRDSGFVDAVKRLFKDEGQSTQGFELEITESAFIDNNEENISRLNQLRELGFSISIDDFGTGYSSLSYLQRLPIDTLKIDRAFIQNLPEDSGNAEITRAIIVMAKSLNIDVIAEGVETPEQQAFLVENGCVNAQGYLFGKPMTLSELKLKFAPGSQARHS